MPDELSTGYTKETSISFSLPTIPSFTSIPSGFRLIQGKDKHDILLANFHDMDTTFYNLVQSGLPVQVSWSKRGESQTWYGYTSFISRSTGIGQQELTTMHCVGTAFPLKERANRVFVKSTIPEAVSQIASEFGFHLISDSDSRRFDQLVMAGHSYWEWIHEQARRIGFAVLVEGANLFFRKLDNLINQKATSIPLLNYNSKVDPGGKPDTDRNLDFFEVLKGDYVEKDANTRSHKFVAGIDPHLKTVSSNAASPANSGDAVRSALSDVLFSEYRSDQVVPTSSDAVSASEGAATMSRLTLPANARASGDARMQPYSLIQVNGTGITSDGYWVITEVEHRVQRSGVYSASLKLATDGTGASASNSFRGQQDPNIKLVNVAGILNGTTLPLRLPSTILSAAPAAILPLQTGFLKTPVRWISDGKAGI